MNVLRVKNISRKVFLTLLMEPGVQRALLPFGHNLSPERWIFVIGCYNSATTLLATILRQHPDIGGLPNEGAFLTDVLPYPDTYGWPRMWSQCMDEMKIEIDDTAEKRAERIKKHWSLWYPSNVSNLVEKSISNCLRIEFLQNYFSPAYFIYIVRNGYAVSKGIQQKANYKRWKSCYKDVGYPIEMCANQWKMTDEIVENSRKMTERLLTIRYENLTADPQGTFLKVTEFLEMPPISSETLGKKLPVHSSSSRITDMNSVSLSRLEESDFEKIENVARETLEKYGYLNCYK